MHLGVFWLGAGNHSAGWRYEGAWSSNSSWPLVAAGAQIAERGKFDLFFISDSLVMDPGDHPAFVSRFEPTTLIAALAAVTRHVGLGATVSTSFSEPFDVARTFMTLHNISGGRAAWNIVTSSHNAAAANFSKERLPEHDLRYEIAGEFVDVVQGLWDTWDDGAIVADRSTGVFLDKSKVHALNHQGRFFSVKGPLNIAPGPFGHPLLIQAGGSAPGQELSARTADLVFSVVSGDKAAAKTAYDDLKRRVVQHGRVPDSLPILPGVMPIIGDTDAQAKDQLDTLQGWLSSTNALSLVSQRLGHDISGYPLDGPIPDLPATTDRGQAFSKTLLDMARRENMTLRDLQHHRRGARALGDLRHRATHRRHVRGVVLRRTGRRLHHHAGLFPGRLRRFRRQGRAGTATPRPLSQGLFRADTARPSRPGRSGSGDSVARGAATLLNRTNVNRQEPKP